MIGHMQAGRSIESIYAELAAAGLVRVPPVASVDDFIGGPRLAEVPPSVDVAPPNKSIAGKAKTGGKKANAASSAPAGPKGKAGPAATAGKKGAGAAAGEGEGPQLYPELSLAQARQEVVASCILPLAAHQALTE